MQIGGLSQCFNRQKVVKKGKKSGVIDVTYLMTTDYKPCSKFAYLRPTLLLDDFTRVLRGTL